MNKQYSISAKIVILLSYDCTLHCRHCIARGRMSLANRSGIITEKELNEIYNRIDKEISKNIYSNQRRLNIHLFGGEPLVYFDKLKEIVNYLETTYGNTFNFIITTNGTLLNEEIVNFFNEHHFRASVSYDGYNSKYLRGFDVLKEKEDLLYKINNFGISTVLSAYNYPLDFFKSIIPFCTKYYEIHGYHCNINLIPIIDAYNELPDYYAINFDKWISQIHQLINSDNPIIQRYVALQKDHIRKNNLFVNIGHHSASQAANRMTTNMPVQCLNCRFNCCCILYTVTNVNHAQQRNKYCKLIEATYGPFYD